LGSAGSLAVLAGLAEEDQLFLLLLKHYDSYIQTSLRIVGSGRATFYAFTQYLDHPYRSVRRRIIWELSEYCAPICQHVLGLCKGHRSSVDSPGVADQDALANAGSNRDLNRCSFERRAIF